MTIQGKVAELLDKYTLVANIGEEDGVDDDMKFEVYEEGPMITDPETGEELGRPETIKIRLEVSEVMEKMSVMETEKTTVRREPLSGTVLSAFSSSHETKQEKMNTERYDSIPEDRKKVKVGDSLRQIEENEDDED